MFEGAAELPVGRSHGCRGHDRQRSAATAAITRRLASGVPQPWMPRKRFHGVLLSCWFAASCSSRVEQQRLRTSQEQKEASTVLLASTSAEYGRSRLAGLEWRCGVLTETCPIRPRRPHLPWLMRARCRSYLGEQGEWCHLARRYLAAYPGRGRGLRRARESLRERLVPHSASLSRAASLVWRFVDPRRRSNCALSRNSAYRRSNDTRTSSFKVTLTTRATSAASAQARTRAAYDAEPLLCSRPPGSRASADAQAPCSEDPRHPHAPSPKPGPAGSAGGTGHTCRGPPRPPELAPSALARCAWAYRARYGFRFQRRFLYPMRHLAGREIHSGGD